MILLAFISGLLASKWLERLMLHVLLKYSKGTRYEAKVKKIADSEIPQKGKIISMDHLSIARKMEQGGNMEEIFNSYGGNLQEE